MTARPREQQRSAALRALLDTAHRVHDSLDLARTLATIAHGVTAASTFEVAVVNMVQPDGSYQVVAVEGGPEVHDALLGTSADAHKWQVVLSGSRDWGALRFVHHDDALARDGSMAVWRPDLAVSDDPTRWHPDDSLFAPLTSQAGDLIGVLSVDMPRDGRLPDREQREILTLFARHASLAIEHALVHQELQANRDLLHHAATHDSLTGLFNRTVLGDTIAALTQQPGRTVAALVIDLDGFKAINDAAGHAVGDEVLRVVGARIATCVRDADIAARLGGDEFVVVVTSPAGTDGSVELADRLALAISRPIDVNGRFHRVEASIGRAVAATPVEFESLLAAADRDMYRSKRLRR